MSSIDQRPDPDRLLTRVKRDEARSNRAKLKVFFGFAPGVGKTYTMLQAARRLRDEGVDVVVGYVETHGRAETAALLEGLTLLPRRTVEHRGAGLEDFALEAALARHPKVLLVDELPHTNAPEGRHTKRWQDVFDLLDAGIDVHTTLNVQHIESLNDVVARITGVTVRETVPDAVLERADEIELVDISLEELLARLHDGKVYLPEQARRAASNFFNYGNLLALRELALRRTADRVDLEVRNYRETHEITRTWATNERLLVAVGPSPGSARLIRATKRMATRLKAPWFAVYVEQPGAKPMLEADNQRLDAQLRLAESLGAELVRLSGVRVGETILDYARRHDVSRIIIGKPTHPRWRDVLRGSLLDDVVRSSGDIDVLVISGDEATTTPRDTQKPRAQTPWWGMATGLALVGVATAVGWLGEALFDSVDVVMLYLLAVMLTASRFSWRASLTTSLLAVVAYDFFFVPPLLTFAVADARHWLTFTMLFAVGATISALTERIRRQGLAARAREERNASLYVLARELGGATDADDAARIVATQVSSIFQIPAAVLYPDGATLRIAARARGGDLGTQELAVARWTVDHGRAAGRGTDTLPGARIVCLPLVSTHIVGVLALEPQASLTTDQRHFLEVIARQAAIAVERNRLADEAKSAAVRVRTEELRSALLSTVSHDLRTPLAIITGSATTLRDGGDAVSPEDRRELVTAVCDEAGRMERLIGNLLDMTRLEAGIDVKRDWVLLEDLIGAATTLLERQLGDRRVEVSIEDVPMIAVDAVLFPQVFVNLIDNALKYTPAQTAISISAKRNAGNVVVEVADRGPGFSVPDPTKLFDKFVRGGQRDRAGVGLGLAIVRGIVLAHGGEVYAENRPGGGALLRFTIPLIGEPPTVTLDEHAA